MAITVANGNAIEFTHPFHCSAPYAPAGKQRNEMDETSVANTDSDTAQVGRRPPPVTNSFSASTSVSPGGTRCCASAPLPLRFFFQKKLHPKMTVPIK